MENRISIIVPIYNVEKYISKCLDSIVNQTLQPYEVLLIDDGSTDNSGCIAKDYAEKYAYIKYFFQENQGQGAARNTGIENSKGDYLLFIDSDDYVKNSLIFDITKLITVNYPDILVYDYCRVTYDGRITEIHSELLDENKLYNPTIHPEILLVDCSPANKLFKKSLFVKHKILFPSKVWYEDLRTIPKVISCSKKIIYLNKTYYYYLTREGSTMNNSNLNKQIDIIYAIKDLINYFKENGLYSLYFNELEFITFKHIYIYAINRILRIKGSNNLVMEFKKFVTDYFPNFKNNNYMYMLTRKEKLFYFSIKHNLYFIIKIGDYLKGRLKK